LARQHPEVIVLAEPHPGHTWARNRALQHSSGDLIIWTDDDVLVPANWLRDYCEAWQASATNIGFWGGPIRPVFPDGCPTWIRENWSTLQGCFATRELGSVTFEFTPTCLPYGANFAVRGDLQRRSSFSTQWGRQPGGVVGEDELELMRNWLDAGWRGQWLPTVGVEHCITAERTTPQYVWQYFRGQGFRLARQAAMPSAAEQRRWALERWVRYGRYQLTKGWAPSPAWLAHLARWGLATGHCDAYRVIRQVSASTH
jgi:hypothetical protein